MLPDIDRAKIVITNYHAFKPRETLEISKTGRSLLQGRDAPPNTIENDGQMLHRVANDLLGFKGVVVLNDEAHHCYREKPDNDEEISADERDGGEEAITTPRGSGSPDWRRSSASSASPRRLRPFGHAVFPARLGLRAKARCFRGRSATSR